MFYRRKNIPHFNPVFTNSEDAASDFDLIEPMSACRSRQPLFHGFLVGDSLSIPIFGHLPF
jgi:hypothetical protein